MPLIWLKNFLELLAGIISTLDRVFDLLGDTLAELWDDFPNVLKMVNTLIGFFSQLPGTVIAGFSLFYFDLCAAGLETKSPATVKDQGRPYQNVMTPANGVRYCAFLIEQSLRFLTLTRDQTIVDAIFGALGRWTFRLLKRFELILKLIGLANEQDFIGFFQRMKAARLGSALVIAVIAALVFVVILSTAITGMFLFGGTILEPKAWQKFTLFSQHKRKREKVRIYRRVGGVAP